VIRLSLDRAALAELVSKDPDLEVNLRTLATEAVAEAFKRKLINQRVIDSVQGLIDGHLRDMLKTSWDRSAGYGVHKTSPSETLRLAIDTHVRERVARELEDVPKNAIHDAVTRAIKVAEEGLLTRLTNALQPKIDELIQARIKSLFK
jgi:chromosome condensin MukBEF complex kleisin-like MukF subunit